MSKQVHNSFEKLILWLFAICGIILMILAVIKVVFVALIFLFGAFLFNKALLGMGMLPLRVHVFRFWEYVKKEITAHF